MAVTFEFNYVGGNSIGFNDPAGGDAFRGALESAAARLGGQVMQDATIQMDVFSRPFDGTAVAKATSESPPVQPAGGFVHRIVPAKILGQPDANGVAADGRVEVYFFAPTDELAFGIDPGAGIGDDEIDFQAVIIHELVHTLGFTSSTRADGSDDSGAGITTPGTWSPYDQFLSDVDGNRLIDADPASPTAFQMDVSATGWTLHSIGGKGPDAGLFFDGPIATAVHGGRVPLYSPATFSLESSVSHLDSEGVELGESSVFSPLTHLMSHGIIRGAAPQELTLVEKAILADVGIKLLEDQPPTVTPPADITLEGNTAGGHSGLNQTLIDFLNAATATDLFDPAPTLAHNLPDFLTLGENTITFTATDASGNVGTGTAMVTVIDTTPPDFSLPGEITVDSNLPTGADLSNTALVDSILSFASDLIDPTLAVGAEPASFGFGTSSVTFTVTDDSGNTASATTSLTVNDIRIVVTTLNDELDADPEADPGDLSLREAISLANGRSGADTIRFADDLGGTVLLEAALGQLEITETVTLVGLGAAVTSIDAQGGSRVIDVTAGDVTIDSVTITGGRTIASGEGGGGLRFQSTGTLEIIDSRLTGNTTAGDNAGGGGLAAIGGKVVIHRSTVSGNQTEGDAAPGGGLYALDTTVSIVDSTVSGNATTVPGSPGGGIRSSGSALRVLNSTISGNASASNGAGIYADRGIVTIDNTTITANQADGAGGGIGVPASNPALTMTIDHSIVAANSDSGAAPDFAGGGVLAGPGSVRFTLVGNNTGTTLAAAPTADPATGNIVGDPGGDGVIDPQLQPLSAGGGPTETHLLMENSPAINAGDVGFDVGAFDPPLIHDQRGVGFPRISGPRIDMGSVEVMGEIEITWPNPADIIFGTELGEDQLNATANIAGTFAYDPPAGTVLGAGQAQVLTATFTPENLTGYQPTTATALINVLKADVVISWPAPDPIVFGTPLGPTQLRASSNVPGTFTYSPPAGTILDAGENQVLSVMFTPTDSSNFNSATSSVLIDVNVADPIVTWQDPDDVAFPTTLGPDQLNATANVPGTFVYSPPEGVLLPVAPNQTLSVTFTPDSDNFAPITRTVQINVLKGDPAISWDDPGAIVAGTPLSETQLDATSSLAGTFVYDPPAGTLLDAGLGQVLTATFTPQDTGRFNVVSKTVTIDVLDQQDFGDAPAPYPVLLSQDGARHAMSTLSLGGEVDLDVDGQPSQDADGDGDDDDGVLPAADIVAVVGRATVSGLVVQASAAAKLDGWIDFNQDGDWDDSGEQVLASVDVVAGNQSLGFTIPPGAIPGVTAARFRLSSSGGLAPTGVAQDGEVEDYLVSILSGDGNTEATVRATGDGVAIAFESSDVVARDGVVEIFRSPLAVLNSFHAAGGPSNDSVTLDLRDLQVPAGGLSLDGGSGGNRLVIIGDGGNVDLTEAGIRISQFRRLDLSADDVNGVVLDTAAVTRLSPGLKRLMVTLGEDDVINVSDAVQWRMTEPVIVDSRFLVTAMNVDSGGEESIEADLPRPWQNFLRAGDVNNDGRLTAADALRIINELGRRSLSDPVTAELVDPLSLQAWPGAYLDHNGDGRATALDALRVINDLARQSLAATADSEESSFIIVDKTATTETHDTTMGDHLPSLSDISRASYVGVAATIVPDWQDLAAAGDAGRDRCDASPNVDRLLADRDFVDRLLVPNDLGFPNC